MTWCGALIFPVVQTENVQLLDNLNIKLTVIFVALSTTSPCSAHVCRQHRWFCLGQDSARGGKYGDVWL